MDQAWPRADRTGDGPTSLRKAAAPSPRTATHRIVSVRYVADGLRLWMRAAKDRPRSEW